MILEVTTYKYRINKIFLSIQGEGYFTGKPCIFIRFSGCNLNCKFCDTNHHTYTLMTIQEILEEIKYFKCKHIVFTGGEPTLQLNQEIVNEFKKKHYYLQIETNGTNCILTELELDWITVSPKTTNIERVYPLGDEYKFIVTEDFDIKTVKEMENIISVFGITEKIYLQPDNNKTEMINKIQKILTEEPQWRLSLQIQKLINIQ